MKGTVTEMILTSGIKRTYDVLKSEICHFVFLFLNHTLQQIESMKRLFFDEETRGYPENPRPPLPELNLRSSNY